jgi:glycosyltransferase involved in cell wall biosynthesis/4-amino-4-deoxy-L-arabinose transferase-like glycosyltransferase
MGVMEASARGAVTSISAFFPCYRDEATIVQMVRRVTDAFDQLGVPGDVTVINDASPDNAASVLERLAHEEPRLRVVTHAENRGYGGALQSGFAAATAEWVFYTDGDGQYDPGELVELAHRVHDDVDVVQGYKLIRADNVARKVIGRIYHRVVSVVFGLSIRDTDCDFRLIRRRVLDQFSLDSTSGVICVELVRKLELAGARFEQVGVHHYPRTSGRSTFFRPRNVAKTLLDLVALWWRLVVEVRREPSSRSEGRGRRRARIGAASALVFAGVFAASLRAPLDRADEAWLLWVAVRANSGARLYRDVYYVSTPLAMWLMQGAVRVFGAHIWVERVLVSASITASVVLVWLIAVHLRISRSVGLLACGLVLLFGTPVSHFVSAYSTLAVALCLAALLASLNAFESIDDDRRETRHFGLAGVLCALAFAAKPNVGIAACAAVIASLLVVHRVDRDPTPATARYLRVVGIAFGATLGATALPFLLSGTLPALANDVFAGKGTLYFAVEGRILPGFVRSFGLLSSPGAPLGANVERLVELVPIVALATLVLTVGGIWRRPAPAQVALCAFAVVGFVSGAPDFAPQHVTEAVPLLLALPVVAYASTRCRSVAHSRWPARVVSAGTAAVLVAGLIAVVSWAHRPATGGRNGLAAEQASPVAGLVITKQLATQTRADLAELRSDTHGTVYLAFLSASYYYLVDHLHDPTAFDYPGRSDLGAGGEQGLIQDLRRRHVDWVCVANHPPPPQSAIRPLAVERYIRTHLHFVEALHVCDLYTVRPNQAELTTASEARHGLTTLPKQRPQS